MSPVRKASIAHLSIWSGRAPPSTASAAILRRSSAPMSAGWRGCAGPALRSGWMGITGASPRPALGTRTDARHWPFPADLPERGQAYDLARDRANIRVSVLSPAGLGEQIGHDGATWLDRELVSRQRVALADEGFGQEVKAA